MRRGDKLTKIAPSGLEQLNPRDDRVRQIDKQGTAQKNDESGKRDIDARADAGMNVIAVDVSRHRDESNGRDDHHPGADHDQRKPRDIAERLAKHRKRAARQARNGKLEKYIELLHQKSESHYGNRGAHPGKEGAFVRSVLLEILDHPVAPCRRGSVEFCHA